MQWISRTHPGQYDTSDREQALSGAPTTLTWLYGDESGGNYFMGYGLSITCDNLVQICTVSSVDKN